MIFAACRGTSFSSTLAQICGQISTIHGPHEISSLHWECPNDVFPENIKQSVCPPKGSAYSSCDCVLHKNINSVRGVTKGLSIGDSGNTTWNTSQTTVSVGNRPAIRVPKGPLVTQVKLVGNGRWVRIPWRQCETWAETYHSDSVNIKWYEWKPKNRYHLVKYHRLCTILLVWFPQSSSFEEMLDGGSHCYIQSGLSSRGVHHRGRISWYTKKA